MTSTHEAQTTGPESNGTNNESLVLAVDIGGTKIEAALINESAVILSESRTRRPTGRLKSSDELTAALNESIDAAFAAASGRPILGIGIGCAGEVNVSAGTVSPLNLPSWRDFPLVAEVQEKHPDLPVTMRIDGVCIALAEFWRGAGQGVANLLGIVVSTGVGGGLVLGGRVYSGPSGNAGHIGHIEIGGMTDRCACGGIGCLEAIASGPNTVAWARARGFTGVNGEDLAAAHANDDPIALAAVQRAGTALGHGIAAATNVIDLDRVVVGGGFSKVSPALLEHARSALAERTGFTFFNRLDIVPSMFNDEGPLLGAAALVFRPDLLD